MKIVLAASLFAILPLASCGKQPVGQQAAIPGHLSSAGSCGDGIQLYLPPVMNGGQPLKFNIYAGSDAAAYRIEAITNAVQNVPMLMYVNSDTTSTAINIAQAAGGTSTFDVEGKSVQIEFKDGSYAVNPMAVCYFRLK
jgi:hypothetical protein